MAFKLVSPFHPTGDQPQAIAKLVDNLKQQAKQQVLLGVTGSGKTFTAAQVIAQIQKPTLVIAHNKTLAAQLYQELRDFFPENAVSYFVSYYDYYQPEAYLPSSDTYIEKEATINDEIDKLRLSATTNLLTRPDTIVVASVSCIYNLGSPAEYGNYVLEIMAGELISRQSLLTQLSNLQYQRSDTDLLRGTWRLRGDVIQVWPAYQDNAVMIDTLENKITKIANIHPISGAEISELKKTVIYPAKHYMLNPQTQVEGIKAIRQDLQSRLEELTTQNKKLEAYRLEQKVNYDLEMIQEFGFVNGIENYSRYFDGRQPGEPPFTLLDYLAESARIFKTDGFLTFIDESHMTVPQVRGMYHGDQARKKNLIDYGFRLPSAMDNRPLQFHEFLARLDQTIYVSATPNDWEISMSEGRVVEQLVRPTGLLDPEIEIKPSQNQIADLTSEILHKKKLGQRVLVTTLTKKMSEALTDYLKEHNPELKVAYLHSDVETLDRSTILTDLRTGKYDVLVGINLLREGLDLPEVTLVAILDADKEGFLRSATSLIQTMGRAARHSAGKAILYADRITGSMQTAIDETKRRRKIQKEFNLQHHITPQNISKPIRKELINQAKNNKASKKLLASSKLEQIDAANLTPDDRKKLILTFKKKMQQAAKALDFEEAMRLRDKIKSLEN